MTTCSCMTAALCATGLRVGLAAAWNCITLLAALAAKICHAAATGCVSAGDAITLCTLRGCQGMAICARVRSSRRRKRKTAQSIQRNSRRSSIVARYPTIRVRYPLST